MGAIYNPAQLQVIQGLVTTQFTNNTTTYQTIAGLTLGLAPGTYSFEAILFAVGDTSTGIKLQSQFSGSYSNYVEQVEYPATGNTFLTVQPVSTAPGTEIAANGYTGTQFIRITGTITVTATGNLFWQGAQAFNVDLMTVNVGSRSQAIQH